MLLIFEIITLLLTLGSILAMVIFVTWAVILYIRKNPRKGITKPAVISTSLCVVFVVLTIVLSVIDHNHQQTVSNNKTTETKPVVAEKKSEVATSTSVKPDVKETDNERMMREKITGFMDAEFKGIHWYDKIIKYRVNEKNSEVLVSVKNEVNKETAGYIAGAVWDAIGDAYNLRYTVWVFKEDGGLLNKMTSQK